jgi:hypothetical protein
MWIAGRRAAVAVDGEEEMRQLHRVSAKSAARAARACLRLNRFESGGPEKSAPRCGCMHLTPSLTHYHPLRAFLLARTCIAARVSPLSPHCATVLYICSPPPLAAVHFCSRALEIHFWGDSLDSSAASGKRASTAGLREGVAPEEAAAAAAFVKSVREMWKEAEEGLARRADAAAQGKVRRDLGESLSDAWLIRARRAGSRVQCRMIGITAQPVFSLHVACPPMARQGRGEPPCERVLPVAGVSMQSDSISHTGDTRVHAHAQRHANASWAHLARSFSARLSSSTRGRSPDFSKHAQFLNVFA